MKYNLHNRDHSLILKEYNHAPDGAFCRDCRKPILCKSSVYICCKADDPEYEHCARFFLHKNCEDISRDVWSLKRNFFSIKYQRNKSCLICLAPTRAYANYCSECIVKVFFDVMSSMTHLQDDRGLWTVQHWSHQHPLRFVERCSTFECDGCNSVATDYSYMCDKCTYWIHQSCANLPPLLEYKHHKHPLSVAVSLPEVYCSFDRFCKICKKIMDPREWLYYCASCRFFAHIHCVKSKTPASRDQGGFDDTNLMHLPALDEHSLNTMMQKRIKEMISPAVDTTAAPPNFINHWAHKLHPLALKNKSDVITIDEDLINQGSKKLIICDGCTKPISPSSDDATVFYNCNDCNYSLHRYCAQFPKETHHPLTGKLKGVQGSGFANDIFRCYICRLHSNGLKMHFKKNGYSIPINPYQSNPYPSDATQYVDVWCACLPEQIKHQAHHHPLKQRRNIPARSHFHSCAACGSSPTGQMVNYLDWPIIFGCEACEFYLHVHCALRPVTITHRWDPHPLGLIISLEDDTEDHPHDFNCERCSQDINTNGWFYHCNACDLSFHIHCICPNENYSNVKFGAANIKIKAHHHNMTLVLNDYNKQKEMEKQQQDEFCTKCSKYLRGEAILECKPCHFVRHYPARCGDY